MTFSTSDYAKSVMRTANSSGRVVEVYTNIMLGLTGEVGELVELIKKHLFHGHPLDQDKVIKELGDVLFYAFWMYQLNCAVTEHAELTSSAEYAVYFSEIDWKNVSASFDRDSQLISLFQSKQDKAVSELRNQYILMMLYNVDTALNNLFFYTTHQTVHKRNALVVKFLSGLRSFSTAIGVSQSFSEIAKINSDKLKKRYPEKFSASDSMNRKD